MRTDEVLLTELNNVTDSLSAKEKVVLIDIHQICNLVKPKGAMVVDSTSAVLPEDNQSLQVVNR